MAISRGPVWQGPLRSSLLMESDRPAGREEELKAGDVDRFSPRKEIQVQGYRRCRHQHCLNFLYSLAQEKRYKVAKAHPLYDIYIYIYGLTIQTKANLTSMHEHKANKQGKGSRLQPKKKDSVFFAGLVLQAPPLLLCSLSSR